MDIASSPLSSPPAIRSSQPTASSTYREARELPFELAQHVHTYYEETLFTQAYNFLLSITNNSASSINNSRSPVIIPSPAHLALAASFTVHPSYTSRTHLRERWNQANAALRLLRVVHKTVGPVNARFGDAFTFRKYDYQALGQRRAFPIKREGSADETDGARHRGAPERLNTIYAGSESIWYRAEDFWQVVGWAFNCASRADDMYQRRWRHWETWLEFMLDVLERDWRLRQLDDTIEESLIWLYIELTATGHAKARRILRAVFADGSTRSLNEFREVFAKELKPPPNQTEKPKKREVNVDIDRDVYGDWFVGQDGSDTSDDVDQQILSNVNASNGGKRSSKRLKTRSRTPNSNRITPRGSGGSLHAEYNNAEAEGGRSGYNNNPFDNQAALCLRIRLLQLLAEVSTHPNLTATSPTTFPDQDELFTLYVEFITPLPLVTFQAIMLPSAIESNHTQNNDDKPGFPCRSNPGAFEAKTLTQLCATTIERLQEPTSPSPSASQSTSDPPPPVLIQFLLRTLPTAASKPTALANARLSILLESSLRQAYFAHHTTQGVGFQPPDPASNCLPDLAKALEEGIARRLDKALRGSSEDIMTGEEIQRRRNTWRISAPGRADPNREEGTCEDDKDSGNDDGDVVIVDARRQGSSADMSSDLDDDDDDEKDSPRTAHRETNARKAYRNTDRGSSSGGGPKDQEEKEAWDWLIESGNRMEMTMERWKS